MNRYGQYRLLCAVCCLFGLPCWSRLTMKHVQSEAINATNPNLLTNAGFEILPGESFPRGWNWNKRNTNASCVPDTKYAHSGKYALKVTNGTPWSGDVYGMIAADHPVTLQTGKPYTLSLWVYFENPEAAGAFWVGDWSIRMQLFRLQKPLVAHRWQRVQLTFTPTPEQCAFTMRLITESQTAGVWVDDVQLEEGSGTTPIDGKLPQLASFMTSIDDDTELESNLPLVQHYLLALAHPFSGVLRAELPGQPSAEIPLSLEAGRWRLTITGHIGGIDDTPRQLTVRAMQQGREVAHATSSVRVFSAENARQRLDALRAKLPAFRKDLDTLRAQGQDISYPEIGYTVLENFIGYTQSDCLDNMKDWHWSNTAQIDATYTLDGENVHSGQYALLLSDATPQAPNKFGVLTGYPVTLQAGKPYTLSAWVNCTSGCAAWIGGGSQWQYRLVIPSTDGTWKQISLTFTPGAADVNFTPMILIESPQQALRIDDVMLVQGTEHDGNNVGNLLTDGGFENVHNELRRAFQELNDLEHIAARLSGQLHLALAGQLRFPSVPRWTGDTRPVINRSSFLAPVKLGVGTDAPQLRPVFFTGYGHFSQVVADLEKLPHYGANIIQIEVGPWSLMQPDGSINTPVIDGLRSTLDRAQRAGVGIALLISPHYFPQWMMDKYPELKNQTTGFSGGFSRHVPVGQQFLQRYITELLTPLKGHPALQSICLSNESMCSENPNTFAVQDWHTWLRTRHGDIAILNRRWGTQYASFDDVPLCDPTEKAVRETPCAQWVDYVRFNQEFFAQWHAMLAAAVHAVDPKLPVHAKVMQPSLLNDNDKFHGADADLFASFGEINGNDSMNFYEPSGRFAQSWLINAMGNDLQRSAKDAPVFDSENHIILDGETRDIPASHVRAALWQQAVHGQSATTIWVWERSDDPKNAVYGNIMHRPAGVETVGQVNYDLNRCADEITALQQAPAQIQLLMSTSAAIWSRSQQGAALEKLYTALAFTGLQLRFITERELEAGTLPTAPVVMVPGGATHLSEAALCTLRRYHGRLVAVGNGHLLRLDEYNRPHANPLALTERIANDTSWETLWQAILPRLAAWQDQPAVQVRDAAGKPIWGVEWRCVQTAQGIVVNLCNYRADAVNIQLIHGNKPVTALDLLTGATARGHITLSPLQTQLLRITTP